jgi:hypothetical protein
LFSITPQDKYSHFNLYKYRIKNIKEIYTDYYNLFKTFICLKKGKYGDKIMLKRILYLYYFLVIQEYEKKKLSMDKNSKNGKQILFKTQDFKQRFTNIREIEQFLLNNKSNYIEFLDFEKLPPEIKFYLYEKLNSSNNFNNDRQLYYEVFDFNICILPQYMKSEYGYDYDDVKEIKEKLNLYNTKSTVNILQDFHFEKKLSRYNYNKI